MSERQPRPYDDIARKWHALAERRRAHVVELRDSGRWQHYYTWDELLEALREAVDTRDTWARLAGLAEGEYSWSDRCGGCERSAGRLARRAAFPQSWLIPPFGGNTQT